MFFNYKQRQQEAQKALLRTSIFSFVAGALVALFTSPVKGSHARKIVKNKVTDTVQNLESKVGNSAQFIKDKAENIKDTVDENAHKAKERMEESVNENRTKIADKINPNK